MYWKKFKTHETRWWSSWKHDMLTQIIDLWNILFSCLHLSRTYAFNKLMPRRDGRHFADDIFTCIFLNENAGISIKISLKFVRKGQINNIPTLVQIMAWRRPGGKSLSEPMIFSLLTHICVTRSHWINRELNKEEMPQRCEWLSHAN